MEGFDKICVSYQQIINYDLDFQEVGHNGAEEYIRKDALLEILQGYSHPLTKLVMQEIIDKINSL